MYFFKEEFNLLLAHPRPGPSVSPGSSSCPLSSRQTPSGQFLHPLRVPLPPGIWPAPGHSGLSGASHLERPHLPLLRRHPPPWGALLPYQAAQERETVETKGLHRMGGKLIAFIK